jgi:hypothetical protein
MSAKVKREEISPLPEIALVLARFSHIASVIVNQMKLAG